MDKLNAQDDILEYYRRELAYLRVQGQDFSRRYPKVAQRLAWTGAESPDPHTERLVEAVAFLTARVHRDLDSEFPRVAHALLDNLCPSLTQTVPSMTIAEFVLDSSQGKVTSGMPVNKGTMLQATATSGQVCRFQVAWDTTLWPLSVSKVERVDARTLRLEFESPSGMDVSELELDSLRLHLGGELLTTMPLHEMLISSLENVQIERADGHIYSLGPQVLKACGFDEGHELIPRPGHVHPAYGLLQEYFAFPRKFQFFDVNGLRSRLGSGPRFALRFVFDHSSRVLSSVGKDTFKLGCVPIINLFNKTSEPIVLDRRRDEYPLVADRKNESSTEIHSIVSVIASDPDAERPVHIASAFSAGEETHDGDRLYWASRQEMSLRKDITGADTFLCFIDRADVRQVPAQPVVYAELLCTNRRLAEQLPAGARLIGQGISATTEVKVLYQPSEQRAPALSSHALWSMVSLLRLNHRSLVDGSHNAQTLRQMLMLFAGESARDQAQVRGLQSLKARPASAQLGQQTWRGHCQGTEVTMVFDVEAFVGNSPLLLAGVLAHFLSLYTTINSFVRVRVERSGEVWKQWPPMSGRQWLV